MNPQQFNFLGNNPLQNFQNNIGGMINQASNESEKFPGLTKQQETEIMNKANQANVTESQKNYMLNDMYQQQLRRNQIDKFAEERENTKRQLLRRAVEAKDIKTSKQSKQIEKKGDVADMIRKYVSATQEIDLNKLNKVPDDQIIADFTADNPDVAYAIDDFTKSQMSSQYFSEMMGFSQFEEQQDEGFFKNLLNSITYGVETGAKGLKGLIDKGLDTAEGNSNESSYSMENLTAFDNYIQHKYGVSGSQLRESDKEVWQQERNLVQDNPEVLKQYMTTASEDALNFAEGYTDALFTATNPYMALGMKTVGAAEQEMGGGVLTWLAEKMGGVGEIINSIPGLSNYRDTLSPEDQQRFDAFVGNVAVGLILGTKNKKNIIKDPKTFLMENLQPNQITKNFVQSVTGMPDRLLGGTDSLAGGAKGLMSKATKGVDNAGNVIDRAAEWGAKKITGTATAQDKLYKAQEPRMNILSEKKNLERRRANSDRANELILDNGYKPTNTSERLDAHQKTLNKLWGQVMEKVNAQEGVNVDQSSMITALSDYIKSKKKLGVAGISSDIKALEAELKSLKKMQAEGNTDIPTLEAKKQVLNDLIDRKGQEASEVYKGGIKLLTQEIGKIEDSIISQIPGEFSDLKRDVGALLDSYEDVFKADMKNQRKKGLGLTETYSRIEGIGDTLGGIVKLFGGDASGLVKGLGKLALGKSLAKASDVDFLIKQGFEDLANERGLAESQASSKTAKYQVADEQGVGKQYKQYTIDGKERADYGELNRVNKLFDREQTLDGLKHDIILSKERGNDIGGDLFIQRKVASDGIKRIEESMETGKGYWVGGDDFITDKSVLNKLLDEKKKIIDYIDNFDESTLKEYNGLGLSEEKISQQINSKEFKDFILDSIAKNTDGTPKDLYHGTTDGGFTIFDINRSGKNANKLGPGIYLSNEPKVAREYTKHMNQETGKLYKEDYDTPEIMKVYARLENPLMIDKELIDLDAVKKVLKEGTKEYFFDNEIPFFLNGKIGLTKDQIKALPKDKRVDLYVDYLSKGNDIQDVNKELLNQVSRAYRDNLEQGLQNLSKATGKDGVFFEKGGSEQYVLWDNSQVKSATDNIGTFDKNNPDIRFQKYGVAGQGEKGISATEGLNIRNFKNGKTVQELANQYGIDTKIVDSISTPEGQKAYGMYGDRLITLSKDLKESTVPHELLHGVFDMVDSKRRTSILEGIQKKLNIDNVQAEEWLADSFSEYYRTGKFGTKGLAKGLVEKVKQFFYEVKSYIDGTYKNEKQIRQLFDDIIDGKIEGDYGVYSDPKFQSVWHGSPADFERFDSLHMGEGEGNQAHGWGHYVAVEEGTARHYAEMQSEYGDNLKYKGKEINYEGEEGEVANMLAEQLDFDNLSEIETVKDNVRENLRADREEALSEGDKARVKELDKMIKMVDDFNVEGGKNLYEVEIPDPIKKDTPTGSNYLEEDGKITYQQVEKIAEGLKDYDARGEWGKSKFLENIIRDLDDAGGEWNDKTNKYEIKGTVTGEKLYRHLSDYLRDIGEESGAKKASKFLESLGYDGIHYFGGTDGEAYVIFNDDALEITKHHKY